MGDRIDLNIAVTDVTGTTIHSVLYPDEGQTVEELRELLMEVLEDWSKITAFDVRECGNDSRIYFNPPTSFEWSCTR